jgi:phospholipase D1/2
MQEELSGVKYQTVQQAHAQEVMGGDYGPPDSRHMFHHHHDEEAARHQEILDQRRRFEESRDEAAGHWSKQSADSIAKNAMLDGGRVSDEPWQGNPEEERDNFVQEELYIHAKVLNHALSLNSVTRNLTR